MSTIKELFTNPEKWTKGIYSKDEAGVVCDAISSLAVCFCLSGALRRVYPVNGTTYEKIRASRMRRDDASTRINMAIMNLFPLRVVGKMGVIPNFNDHLDTTFEDILKVVEEAGV